MARTHRNELSRARRGVAVRGERRTVRSLVNGPVAESIAWIQQLGAHLDFLGSSLVPSSGVKVQLEVQTSCLADGLNAHQPMCMGLQPSRTGLDIRTLAEFDATQRLEGSDIGAANLETVFPLEFGNQSSESIRASLFPSDGSLASVLSCGAGSPTSNALHAAPTAADFDFPAALCRAPEVMNPLPDILPLHEAERLHLLNELFQQEHDQSLEEALFLSPPKQLYQPEHLEGPMQMQNCDLPSHSPTSRSLLPLSEMIHGHSATHPQSYPFGHWLQQSSQQTLTDLNEDLHKQPLGSAPFRSSPSNEWCAMENSAGYGPLPPDSNFITDVFPNVVEAAPTVSVTPFDSLTQSLATSALPNSPPIIYGSAHSASANHSNVSERLVTAGRGRNRLPRGHQATVERLRQIRTAPALDASPSTVNLAEVMLGRIETQRQNHMKAERRKRKQMNELYATMRSCLPLAARKSRTDYATVLLDMTNHIKRRTNELKKLEQELKHFKQLVAAFCDVNQSINDMGTAAARLFPSKGLNTCADNIQDLSALTASRAAVPTLPAIESYSGLGSILGTYVSINYRHDNYTLTVSSSHLGTAVALLEPMLIAIQDHHVEVVEVLFSTSSNTHVYTLQCKASPGAEKLRNILHSELEGIVHNFSLSSSGQGRHG